MLRSGMSETKRAKLMVAVVATLLLAAFQMALQAKPANAYEVRISITGAGQVRETTPANLVGSNCFSPSTTPTGTLGRTCLAGTPSGDYGYFWDVDYVAEPASGYTFARWESDGTSRPAIICDRSTPAATSPTYTGATCKFRTPSDLQTRAVFVDNQTPATPTINSTSPSSTLVNGPKTFNFSTASDPTFRHFECRVTPTVQPFFQSCSSGISFNPPDGSYTFQVRAVDWSGNISSNSASHSWAVDKTGPVTSITAGPDASSFSNNNSPTFGFTANESSSFQCSFDGPGINTGFSSCSSGKSYPGLSDGQHTFSVRGTDNLGNLGGTVNRTFSIDTTAPGGTVSINGGAGFTNSTSVTLTPSATDPSPGSGVASMRFSNDGVTWSEPEHYATSKAWTLNGGEGTKTVHVQYKDGAGNVSTVRDEIVLDTASSETVLSSGPSGTVRSTSASFGFTASEANSTFQCSLDGSAFASCASPEDYANLKNGSHTFRVRAIDAAGNVDATPARRTWTVDTIKPTTSGMSPRHTSITRDTTPTIKATVKDNLTNLQKANIKLYVNNVLISPTKYSYSASTDLLTYNSPKLSKGKKTVKVVATDAAGNVGIKSWYFTIR